jgi:predicted nucleic acid-binding protein
MAGYVLDTNVVSALMRGDRGAQKRLLSESPSAIYLVQPVIAEISYGLARLAPSRRKTALASRFRLLADTLPRAAWSDPISFAFGAIKAKLERNGEPIEDFDVAIAAHALVLSARLATRNVKHFIRIDELDVEAW